MSEGLNRAMLLGHLGADPELRVTQSGQAVLNIRLATSETYLDRDKQRKERTDWHNVVIWGKRAEALAKLLGKGDRIYVEGGIRTSSYDDRDGNKRYKTEVNATQVLLLGKSGGGGGESPRGGGGGYGRGGSRSAPADTGGDDYDGGYGGGAGADDDIPF